MEREVGRCKQVKLRQRAEIKMAYLKEGLTSCLGQILCQYSSKEDSVGWELLPAEDQKQPCSPSSPQ